MSSLRTSDTVAGRYLVGRSLEHDPLFSSFAATDQRDGRDVLLLAVNPGILASAQDHNIFLHRVEHSIFLKTPGTAEINRVTSERGQTVIVGDMVRGPSLRSLIDTRRRKSAIISPEEGISILRGVAAILEQAPTRAHGYLIPNVVFVEKRRLVLVAFGLTQALPRTRLIEAFAHDATVCRYLAPEVKSGHLAEPGSDVFSLAVMAAELLGARRPREILGRVLDAAIDERPHSPLAFVDEVEAALRLTQESAVEPAALDELDPSLVRAARFLDSERSAALDTSLDHAPPSSRAPEPSAHGPPPSPPATSTRNRTSLEATRGSALAQRDPDRWKSAQSSGPLFKPSSDSWSWALLLALVGGVLLAVYLVAFVALTMMD